MSDDGISGPSDHGNNAALIRRSSLDRSGKLILPQRPAQAAPSKPPFQQLMDQMKGNSDPLGNPNPRQTEINMETHQGQVSQVAHQEERRGTFRDELQRRAREFEPETEHRKGRTVVAEGEKPKGKAAEEKVIARSPLSERQRDGQGQGKGGNGKEKGSRQGQGYGTQALFLNAQLKSLPKGKLQELGQSQFLQNMKGLLATAEKREKQPTVFNKTLLDQIVQYVRLLTRPDGKKEMDLSLHEKVFKGLRLKVSMVEDKAEATFMTQSEEVRDLFLANRSDIEAALKEKGIEVAAINVIMTPRA